ncbi:pyridoxamine 5'-phosphate oxidase family protein [Neobacillus pocheonensis]|uniref:pyridoxamine 5'-phosphate oxidase family protein n=1 Tax=Neobacillus pocheonensis TaxID=363869 RepID=UPI003D29F51A
MNHHELKEKFVKIIADHRTGVLSTVENNKPHSRYMTFYYDNSTLYTPTKKATEKIEEIENNSFVSVLLGYEKKGQSDSYIEISGTSSINDTQDIKNQFWEDSFNQWFDGPEDPNFVFIQIKPETVRILNLNGEPPQEFTL